jgi:hypothetical protein
MKYTKIELPEDFEKGQCGKCPLSFRGTTGLSDDEDYEYYCVLFSGLDGCPLEIESELGQIEQ